ncbi:condensation domain-containing protein [Streptomyces sp. SID3343]|uniref:condensation domain-containing protein n=1 Tax=Streptomyces sp. SID3343 TaxID=2690260 RepID=UPI001F1CF12F|nr:condensation domain-containing protein [Streptomyces sp. SID3343]
MTFLSDYVPRVGELVEFRIPDHVVEKAKHAPVHPVPPSPVQENHLARYLANLQAGRPQSPWLGLAFDLPGRIDTAALAGALRKWTLRHETMLTWFSAEPNEATEGGAGTTLTRHMVTPEYVDVQPVPRGAFTSEDAVREHLREQFHGGTSPMCWPPFTAAAVLGEDSSTVYFAIDHAHSDAYSMLLVFDELRALYQAEQEGTEAVLPEVGSYLDAGVLEHERAAALQADSPGVQSWVGFLLSGPMPSFPLALGLSPGETRASLSFELDLLTAAEADAFAKACRPHGAGFSAGLLAALGVVHRDLGGRSVYRGLSVVHTRNEVRWLAAQGWFINLVPVAFPLTEDGADSRPLSLVELLGAAGAGFRSACKLASVSPLRVAELAGFPLQSDDSAVLPIVSYIDGRHARGSRDWEGANCNGLYDSSPSSEVMMWVNRRWDSTYMRVTYPDTPEARVNVPRLFDRFQYVVRRIAQGDDEYTCGPTVPASAGC